MRLIGHLNRKVHAICVPRVIRKNDSNNDNYEFYPINRRPKGAWAKWRGISQKPKKNCCNASVRSWLGTCVCVRHTHRCIQSIKCNACHWTINSYLLSQCRVGQVGGDWCNSQFFDSAHPVAVLLPFSFSFHFHFHIQFEHKFMSLATNQLSGRASHRPPPTAHLSICHLVAGISHVSSWGPTVSSNCVSNALNSVMTMRCN